MASSRLPSWEKVPCTIGSIYFAFGAARFGFVASLIALSIVALAPKLVRKEANLAETDLENKFKVHFLLRRHSLAFAGLATNTASSYIRSAAFPYGQRPHSPSSPAPGRFPTRSLNHKIHSFVLYVRHLFGSPCGF